MWASVTTDLNLIRDGIPKGKFKKVFGSDLVFFGSDPNNTRAENGCIEVTIFSPKVLYNVER